jgi:hypothetical protein
VEGVSNEQRIDDLTGTQVAVIERWFREKREMTRLAEFAGIDGELNSLWNDPGATSDQVRRVLYKVADHPLFAEILDILDADPNRS